MKFRIYMFNIKGVNSKGQGPEIRKSFPLRRFSVLLMFIITGCVYFPFKKNWTDSEYSAEYVFSKNNLTGDLYTPKGEGPFPGVLLIHGGSWAGGNRSHMAPIARDLANNGFVVFNINYRFAPDFLFPAQLEDCRDAVRWLRYHAKQFKLIPQKIGVYGYSAGGHLASLLGTAQTDDASKVQAVVAGSAPHDLTIAPDSKAVERFLGSSYSEDPELFKNASPISYVTSDDPPMFLYHGLSDSTVYPEHTIRMHQALNQLNVKNEVYFAEGYGHVGIFLFDSASSKKAINFLNVNLK